MQTRTHTLGTVKTAERLAVEVKDGGFMVEPCDLRWKLLRLGRLPVTVHIGEPMDGLPSIRVYDVYAKDKLGSFWEAP